MATKKKESDENIVEEVKVEEPVAEEPKKKVSKQKDETKAFIARKLKVINSMTNDAKKKYLAERIMLNRKEI